MNDTSREFQALLHQKIMERSGEERLLMGDSMFETARGMALASLPAGLSLSERRYNLFLRFYGRDFDSHTIKQIKQRIFSETPRQQKYKKNLSKTLELIDLCFNLKEAYFRQKYSEAASQEITDKVYQGILARKEKQWKSQKV